ncbi:MAG: spore cortex biosynthesis protein YabQ [Ruminococcus sp.]|nr:spore cortex biosynthesis protein YabQ [Ruminococcus sp.]
MNIPETFFTVHEQLLLFGISCLFGAALGVFYDVFRTLRIILPHNTCLVIIEDVLFMSAYGIFIMLFTSAAARGEFRVYYIIGNLLGFIVYFFTVGSAVIAAMRKIFRVLFGILMSIIRPFQRTYVFLREKASRKFVGNSKVLVKNAKNMKIVLLKPLRMMYNKRDNKKKECE